MVPKQRPDSPTAKQREEARMNQEQAWKMACEAYDAAEFAADEQYAVSIFCASCAPQAIGDAEAQFDADMRIARRKLDVARFAWQA
jgi:hypothetical protein